MDEGYVLPPDKEEDADTKEEVSYQGAFVLDAERGLHPAVAICDFASLYPSVCIGWCALRPNLSAQLRLKSWISTLRAASTLPSKRLNCSCSCLHALYPYAFFQVDSKSRIIRLSKLYIIFIYARPHLRNENTRYLHAIGCLIALNVCTARYFRRAFIAHEGNKQRGAGRNQYNARYG